MKSELTLKEILQQHPEFIFGNKVYRYSYASGDWLYLDQRNQWRVVPKNWTHIIRQLPYAEQMEVKARHADEGIRFNVIKQPAVSNEIKTLGRKGAKLVNSKIAIRFAKNTHKL